MLTPAQKIEMAQMGYQPHQEDAYLARKQQQEREAAQAELQAGYEAQAAKMLSGFKAFADELEAASNQVPLSENQDKAILELHGKADHYGQLFQEALEQLNNMTVQVQGFRTVYGFSSYHEH